MIEPETKRIDSLTAMRFLVIVMLYFHHLSYPLRFGLGQAAVTFFFCLSGFVMAYSYVYKFVHLDSKQLMQFSVKRLSKLYPLHILMFICSLPIIYATNFQTNIYYALCNVLLLQSYFPMGIQVFAFNGPAWFMSDLILFYLLTPFILSSMHKIRGMERLSVLLALLLICFFFEICLTYPFASRMEPFSFGWWFVYVSPYTRVFDYCIGLICGLIFVVMNNKILNSSLNIAWFSVLEIIVVLLFGISMYVLRFFPYPSLGMNVYFIPFSILVILTFAFQRGIISSILRRKVMIYLGDLSFTIYLVHQIIIRYMEEFFTSRMMGMKFTVRHLTSQILLLFAIVCLSDMIRRYFVEPSESRILTVCGTEK